MFENTWKGLYDSIFTALKGEIVIVLQKYHTIDTKKI